MKVLVELNLTNPQHQQLFDQLRGPTPPPEYVNAMAPPNPAGPVEAQQQPSFAPPGLSSPSSAGPPSFVPPVGPPQQPVGPPQQPVGPPQQPTGPPQQPVGPPQQPVVVDAARPLRDQLSDAFSAAFAKNPKAAEELSTKLRAEIGVDINSWTDQQVQQAITQVQAIARF